MLENKNPARPVGRTTLAKLCLPTSCFIFNANMFVRLFAAELDVFIFGFQKFIRKPVAWRGLIDDERRVNRESCDPTRVSGRPRNLGIPPLQKFDQV